MIDYIVNSVFNSITYILPIGNGKDCWLVDCGDVEKVIEQGWKVKGVLLTHSHFDHIYGLNRLMEVFPDSLVYTNEAGAEGLQNPKWNYSKYHEDMENFVLSKLDNIKVVYHEGSIQLDDGLFVNIIFTPGHEPSCISYLYNNYLFTGDSYIPGIKVVTTFPRSDKYLSPLSLARLKQIEQTGVQIMPGHYIEYKKAYI